MLEFDNLFITTVPLSIVLRMFYTVENVFVRGQFIYFLCYTIGEAFGNIWWVVGVKLIYKGLFSVCLLISFGLIFPR